jgi:arsenite-transporting ATPase
LRLLLFTGTGGAGATTVAAATALHAARRGVKTLLLSLDDDSLPAALDPPAGTAVGPAGDGTVGEDGGVQAEVDPGLLVRRAGPQQRSARARAALTAPLERLADALGVDRLDERELPLLPLVDELATLLEVRDAAASGADLVVVDGPGLAGAVRLAALPAAAARGIERLLPVERRMLWVMGHGAAPGSPPPRGAVEAAERLDAELAAVRQVLQAPEVRVRLVVAPRRAALARAARARTALALHGLAVDALVAPRLVPGAGEDAWRGERARAESAALADAASLFAPLPVLRAGERPVEPVTAADLADLAQELYGDAVPTTTGRPGDDPPDRVGAQPVVERDGDRYLLVVALPGARRGEVEVSRRGDDVLLDVGGERRALRLPSGLQRCTLTAARLHEGTLRLEFVPDPALWRGL